MICASFHHNRSPRCRRQSGFTLIDMSIMLVVVSLCMIAFFAMDNVMRKRDKIDITYGHVVDVSTALQEYARRNGVYPAPASVLLNVNTSGTAGSPAAIPASCTGPAVGAGVYCVQGGYPNLNVNGNTDNSVIIGAVPYTVLGMNPSRALDRYGHKLTYAVSRRLLFANSFNDQGGTIRLVNELASSETVKNAENGSAGLHFIVVSHGQDGVGAFRATGGTSLNAAQIPCTAGMLESANCNFSQADGGDAVFRAGLTQPDAADPTNNSKRTYIKLGHYSLAPGPNYYDDEMSFTPTVFGELWQRGRGNQLVLGAQNGQGNVGIGGDPTCNPDATTGRCKGGYGLFQVVGVGNNLRATKIEVGGGNQLCTSKTDGTWDEAGCVGILPIVTAKQAIDIDNTITSVEEIKRNSDGSLNQKLYTQKDGSNNYLPVHRIEAGSAIVTNNCTLQGGAVGYNVNTGALICR